MSKENHGFSPDVAQEVGVNCALIIQHLLFLQKSFAHGKQDFRRVWVRRSVKTLRETYPYFSAKEISGANERLEKGGYILSKIENDFDGDRTKSYQLTEKGLLLMGIPFYKKGNGMPKGEITFDEKENDISPKGKMTIKESCTSFVPSFVEKEKAASPFHLPENEKQTLEAEKKETPPPNSAPPPPLIPPFTPTGETIEPKPATIVRMYSPEHPDISIVDSVPGEYRPATPYKRVNIGEEITRLKTDELAKETFALVRKIPSSLFAEYVEAFEREIGGTGETYPNQPAFRKHFFNWSGCRYEQSQRKATIQNGKRSSLNAAGGDLSKYEETQRF